MKIKKYTRVTAFFLAVCTVLLMLPLSVRADEYWPDGVKTQSKSAIVMEVNTGTVLYEKKSHEKHYPASITKIMTVLLAIENCDMDKVVSFFLRDALHSSVFVAPPPVRCSRPPLTPTIVLWRARI